MGSTSWSPAFMLCCVLPKPLTLWSDSSLVRIFKLSICILPTVSHCAKTSFTTGEEHFSSSHSCPVLNSGGKYGLKLTKRPPTQESVVHEAAAKHCTVVSIFPYLTFISKFFPTVNVNKWLYAGIFRCSRHNNTEMYYLMTWINHKASCRRGCFWEGLL